MNFLRGIVAKVFVYTLFGLLIASFAIWGVGDIFRGGGHSQTVATVGEQEISEAAFRSNLAQDYSLLRQRIGQQVDPEMARAIGLPQQALNRLVVEALFIQQADDLDLAVTEDTLRSEIVGDPSFRDALNTFDRNRFQAFLRSQRISEAQFLERLSAQVVRDRVVGAIGLGVEAPRILAEGLYRFQAQARIADYVELPFGSLEEIAEPDAAELQSFYDATQDTYMAPEFRTLTYIDLSPQAFIAEMAVSEDELRTAYEEQRTTLGTPERRSVSQMIFDDEAAAAAAVQRLQTGADFASLAEELTGQAPVDFGSVVRSDLPGDLAEAAFALENGESSQPVETSFGWHLLHVAEIQEGETPSFEAVRDQVREDLLFGRAIDELISIANQLDDELAGGATLEEAAQTLNLPVSNLDAYGREGRDSEGGLIEGLPQTQSFSEAAFRTEAGDTSLLLETDDGGYFILRVDGVIPPTPRPLEEIREQVVTDWKIDQRDSQQLERASDLVARLEEGQTLQRVAEAEGLQIRTTPPMTRDESDPNVTPSERLPSQLFRLEVGQPTIADATAGQIVAVLREIVEADPATAEAEVTALRSQLQGALAGDVLNLYATSLEREYGVSVDQAVIDRILADF
ncbi:peptidyl-prolyl cis-trans isomerase [Algihabitans albus]|uniref:peptidyl-prolyl cis-trans isomerase n=1 Tax=Algihabitans albus TaxID=2164067 RepID=UPI0013C357B1|nr:peptidyl-prolyl cis-trans isomerase [Algihabitans albus]